MKDIFDEAVNDYKEEKKLKRLKRFLSLIFILTIIGILFIFIYGNYQDKSKKKIQEYTGILLNLSKSNVGIDNPEYNEQIEILVNQKDKRIKELALLDIEAKYANNKDIEKAIRNLDLLINGEYSEKARNLALISKFGIILDRAQKNEINEEDKKFIDYFNKKFTQENEIFYGKALLYRSLWYINQGDTNKAKELLSEVKAGENVSQFDKENADCILNNLIKK